MPSFSVPWHYRVAALRGAAGNSWSKLSSGTPLVVAWQNSIFLNIFFIRLTLRLIGWLCYRGWLTVAIVLLLWQGGEERKETERRKEIRRERRGEDRRERKGENRRDEERGEEREQGKKDKMRGRAEDRRGEENRRKRRERGRRGKRMGRRGEKRKGKRKYNLI